MKLKILPQNDDVRRMYEGHGHYHEGDSGLDLFCTKDMIITANAKGVPIDFEISCSAKDANEENTSYFLIPRSSISSTTLRMSNSIGLIDAGYRNNIIAKVDNIGDKFVELKRGTRLFQIISPKLEPISIEVVDILSETERGFGGFGST